MVSQLPVTHLCVRKVGFLVCHYLCLDLYIYFAIDIPCAIRLSMMVPYDMASCLWAIIPYVAVDTLLVVLPLYYQVSLYNGLTITSRLNVVILLFRDSLIIS